MTHLHLTKPILAFVIACFAQTFCLASVHPHLGGAHPFDIRPTPRTPRPLHDDALAFFPDWGLSTRTWPSSPSTNLIGDYFASLWNHDVGDAVTGHPPSSAAVLVASIETIGATSEDVRRALWTPEFRTYIFSARFTHNTFARFAIGILRHLGWAEPDVDPTVSSGTDDLRFAANHDDIWYLSACHFIVSRIGMRDISEELAAPYSARAQIMTSPQTHIINIVRGCRYSSGMKEELFTDAVEMLDYLPSDDFTNPRASSAMYREVFTRLQDCLAASLRGLQYRPYLSETLQTLGTNLTLYGGVAAAIMMSPSYWHDPPPIPSCFPIPADSGIDPHYVDPHNTSIVHTRECLWRNETPWYQYARDDALRNRAEYFLSPSISVPALAISTVTGGTCLLLGKLIRFVGERPIAEFLWKLPLHPAVDVDPEATAIALYLIFDTHRAIRELLRDLDFRVESINWGPFVNPLLTQIENWLTDVEHPERRMRPAFAPPVASMLT